MLPNDQPGSADDSRRLTRHERVTIAASFLIGALLLAGSFLIAREASPTRLGGWTEGLLLDLGAAVLLVAPIEWFSARLRRRVADADARQTRAIGSVRAETQDLTDRVKTLDSRVTNLAELQQQVAADTTRQREADQDLFRNLGTAPTRETLLEALKRAAARKLIGERGTRVPIAENAELRLCFLTEDDHRELVVRLENIYGHERRKWNWLADQDAAAFFGQVADALDGEQELRQLNLEFAFRRLSATLMLADTKQHVRPIVEYFPDQWALTEYEIITTDQYGYGITHSRPDRIKMDAHVKTKPWLDYDSYERAHEVASYLFPVTPPQLEVEQQRIHQEGGSYSPLP